MAKKGIQIPSPLEAICTLFYFHYIEGLAYDEGDDGKEKEKWKDSVRNE